jgi:hypothetical protein
MGRPSVKIQQHSWFLKNTKYSLTELRMNGFLISWILSPHMHKKKKRYLLPGLLRLGLQTTDHMQPIALPEPIAWALNFNSSSHALPSESSHWSFQLCMICICNAETGLSVSCSNIIYRALAGHIGFHWSPPLGAKCHLAIFFFKKKTATQTRLQR